MKLLYLFAFGLVVVAALPQNEERSRTRGIRRFSLATPGLQAGRISENEVVSDRVQEKTAVSDGAEPRTRTRGAGLLRRGPVARTRGRTVSENQDPTESVAEEVVEELPEFGSGRGLRIKRPLKKITTLGTTTTTSTAVEDVVGESTTHMSSSNKDDGMMVMKSEEGMLTEESKPVMKDEVMPHPIAIDQVSTQEQIGITVEEPVPEEPMNPKPESKSQSLPRPKKLRPIPIKLGRRGQNDADQAGVQVELAAPESQDQGKSVDSPASSHRFATRAKSPLQVRRRQPNRQANQETAKQETEAVATEEVAAEAPKNTRTRSRVPILSRNPIKGAAPRRRVSKQPENAQEESIVPVAEDSAITAQEPETRNEDEVATEKRKPTKIQVRIRTPTAAPHITDKETNDRTAADISSPSIGVPVSEDVLHGRPPKLTQRSGQDPEPTEETRKSQFPTPHYGGKDLVFKAGEVHVTQIGTIEDTPTKEIQRILSGLGSKRRGLARPQASLKTTETPADTNIPADPEAASSNQDLLSEIDLLYDYIE